VLGTVTNIPQIKFQVFALDDYRVCVHSRRNLVGLRMMLSTLLLSLPMMLNVAAVTLLVYFIFAVVGVELFGNVMWSDNIGPYANFQNTGTAMLTLFRMMTGGSQAHSTITLTQVSFARPESDNS
jgi:Ion transport protein